MSVDDFFRERAQRTQQRIESLSASFVRHLQKDGEAALGADGCVYVVGSAGRGEMSESSDLDLFLVTHDSPTRLREILPQAAVLRMMEEQGLPKPSKDALFLKLYAADQLERQLGDPQDDPDNTFTVRMLLVLESKPLHNEAAYERLLERVVDAYWRNNEEHPDDYLPLVLVNDIVRYWRVLLLNYEAKFENRRLKATGADAMAAFKQAKRFASYKLRFSRSMTCYSMIARLLAETVESGNGNAPHVSRASMLAMIKSTPVQRLQQVRSIAAARGLEQVPETIDKLLASYRSYLETRDKSESLLTEQLAAEPEGRELFGKAVTFGQMMFELIESLGKRSPLYRYVVA